MRWPVRRTIESGRGLQHPQQRQALADRQHRDLDPGVVMDMVIEGPDGLRYRAS